MFSKALSLVASLCPEYESVMYCVTEQTDWSTSDNEELFSIQGDL
jgi:hypothetical protein